MYTHSHANYNRIVRLDEGSKNIKVLESWLVKNECKASLIDEHFMNSPIVFNNGDDN